MKLLPNLILTASWLIKLTLATEVTQTTTSVLRKDQFTSFKILKIDPLTPDTNLYRFEIPDNRSLNLPITSCVQARRVIPGKDDIIRPYTPVSVDNPTGHFDVIIKLYPNGTLTSYIKTLKVGDSLEFKGPFPKFNYQPNTFKEIGLVAAGTGITPMLQLIRKIMNDPTDKTKISLIFANRHEEDIILKTELDTYSNLHPNQFKVHYTLSVPYCDWQGSHGHITKSLLTQHLPKPQSNTKIFVCGPNPMVESISGIKISPQDQGELKGSLLELGYTKDEVYKF